MLFEEKVAMLVGLQLWYFEDEQPPYMVDLLDLHFQNILPPQTQVSVLKNKCYIIILTTYCPSPSSLSFLSSIFWSFLLLWLHDYPFLTDSRNAVLV